MSFPEAPAPTEAQQILASLDELKGLQARHTEAVNALGQNVQWIIDQAKGIFEMFSNPAFMSMIPQMMQQPQEAVSAGDNGPTGGTESDGIPGG